MEILSAFFTFRRVLYPQFASLQSAAGAAEDPLHPEAPLCPCQPTPDPRCSVLYPPPGPPTPSYCILQDSPTLSAFPRMSSRNRPGLETLEHLICTTAAGIPPHPQYQGHHGPELPHLPWLPAAMWGIPAAIPGGPCSIRMGWGCSAVQCMPEDAALAGLLHVPLLRMGVTQTPGVPAEKRWATNTAPEVRAE